MRMRTKKWAKPELAVCEFYIKDATQLKSTWANRFKRKTPIHLELGCGKGLFVAQAGAQNENVNFIAVDLSSDMLGLTKRRIESVYHENNRQIDNVLITWQNIERIDNMLSEKDEIERIYINFCNPWFKPMQYKKRLTHTRQLLKYRGFLKNEGEIRFKTDDDELFNASIKYFEETGFEIIFISRDFKADLLEKEGFSTDYVTEHEQMYTSQGIKTKYLIAKKLAEF